MTNSELILTKVYSFENNSMLAKVGMNSIGGEYNIQVALTLFHKKADNNVVEESVLFEIAEFEQLKNLVLSMKNIDPPANIPNALLNVSDVDESQSHKLVEVENRYQIGQYNVTLCEGKLEFSDKKQFVISPTIFHISLRKCIQFINRFNAAINYYVAFLEKYQNYARLVHIRIVKYYSDWLKNEPRNHLFFTFNYLKNNIISLESSSLPKVYHVICDYSCLDFNICYLIDAEVRLNSVYAIYIQVILANL